MPAPVDGRGRPARLAGLARAAAAAEKHAKQPATVGRAGGAHGGGVAWASASCVSINSSAVVGQPAATTMSSMMVTVGLPDGPRTSISDRLPTTGRGTMLT